MPKELPGIGLVYDGQEIAALFGVSIYTIMRDYRLGRLAGRKFGRQILFTGDSIKAFLESGRPARRGGKDQPADQGGDVRRGNHKGQPTGRELQEMTERNRVIYAMKQAGNHRRAAAKIMGCSEPTLRARFKKYGLEFPQNKGVQG
ncbi:MAG: helix-turn-helix domain-containing protein [Saccharofermentanaceae bacterium]|jgi:hypothetical protein